MAQTYFDLINLILLLFSILSLGALAGLAAERVGIVNIAIEGQMAIGALFFAIAGFYQLHIVVAYLIAILAGILISLVHGFTTIKMKSDHIISGLALNLLVAGLAPFLIDVLSQGAGYIETGYVQKRFGVQGWGSAFNAYIIMAVVVLVIVWYLINKTSLGMRFVATGENPKALESAGVSANKQRWIGLIISGTFAGLSGAIYTTFISNLFRGSVYGTGFMALAVLIFGQWRVKSIAMAAGVFSIFTALASYDLAVLSFIPRNIQGMLPYIITVISLILFSKTTKVPKAAGQKVE